MEVLVYFRGVPIDPNGIGEAVHWFFPFWFSCEPDPTSFSFRRSWGLLVYDYLNEEKPTYIISAAVYLVLLGTLFPFEQICRWGTYSLM